MTCSEAIEDDQTDGMVHPILLKLRITFSSIERVTQQLQISNNIANKLGSKRDIQAILSG